MSIAVFDSGIGGITVLKEALKMLPDRDFIYYADTNNVPYGTKPKEHVRDIIFSAVDFLSQFQPSALVIACNTATSVAAEELRNAYAFPIIGMEPAVKPALTLAKENQSRVLVFATPLTLKEKKFEALISKIDVDKLVDFLPLPELVTMAEEFNFQPDSFYCYLKDKLNGYDLAKYSSVVLGCTHFVLYRDLFKKYLPLNVQVIDGNKGTVAQLKRVLEIEAPSKGKGSGEVSFFTSGTPMKVSYKEKLYAIIHALRL